MIAIRRVALAPTLAKQIGKWTVQLKNLLSSGEPIPSALARKYRNHELKSHLRNETHGKCAYCESKVTHVYPGDVEHILPKTTYRDRALDPTNLTFACFECNNRKGDFDNPSEPLVNPYVDEPSDHLVAAGPLIKHRLGDNRGFLTESILELNRASLFERRTERLNSLHRLAHLYSISNAPVKDILKEQLLEEAQDEQEYAFVVRTYLRDACGISENGT
jgi:hypothetical protein